MAQCVSTYGTKLRLLARNPRHNLVLERRAAKVTREYVVQT